MLKNELRLLTKILIQQRGDKAVDKTRSSQISKAINDSCSQARETWEAATFSNKTDDVLCRYFDLHFSFLNGLIAEKSLSGCPDVQNALFRLMDHLLAFYSRFINQKQWVSPGYITYRISLIEPDYLHFIKQLSLLNEDQEFKFFLTESLDPLYRISYLGSITLFALSYRVQLMTELSGKSYYLESMTSDSLTSTLISFNFNHVGFFSYLRKRFLFSISNLRKMSYARYIAELIAIVPVYEEGSSLCFDSKWPHISVMYREWLNDYRALLNLSYPFGRNGTSLIKLPLNISVKQLACLIRALYELGFYGQVSLTAIFDHAAAAFSTKRQQHISAESISNAYYALEQSSSLKVFRILSKALDFLKPYCFPA
ncbi:hypothetical protein ABIC74_000762 [Mucilaginibacter rubeus]|uniref:hypothetical protein n=1 Tax=Mucilaginibacter rubeus TaxID=2027860 RepID=UPI00339089D3